MFLCIYHKNSFENFKTDVKIGIFPIPITSKSGFGIFKQNWENPDKIGMVGQSVYGRCASSISGQLGNNNGISTDKFTLNIFDTLNLLSMIALCAY